MRFFVLLYFACIGLPAAAQFAPQVGIPGSTAISKNDPAIVAWASTCTVERGWMNIADKAQGVVSLGVATNGAGKADNQVVSLGDSGIAILTFPGVLYNGPGADFAVFENAFGNPNNQEEAFLELAFVEVSSDGVNYVRFPASSNTNNGTQVPAAGVYMNASNINNLAGKYLSGYGTPFDLEELKGTPGLDVDNITHVRLVDVIGDVGPHASTDKDNKPINDPYPSEFPSGGFDLDAVAAMHIPGWWPSGVNDAMRVSTVKLYPNPAKDVLWVDTKTTEIEKLAVTTVTGVTVLQSAESGHHQKVDISHLPGGTYYLILKDANGNEWVERFTKY